MTGSALSRWTLYTGGIGCRFLHSICFRRFIYIFKTRGGVRGGERASDSPSARRPADDGKRFSVDRCILRPEAYILYIGEEYEEGGLGIFVGWSLVDLF